VERLALCFTTASFAQRDAYMERAVQVRKVGVAPLVEDALGRWFTASFLSHHPALREDYAAMLAGTDARGYAYCCEAVARADLTGALGRIKAPALVVSGALDPVVAHAQAAATMNAIPGASLAVLAGAAHLGNVERSGPFNDVLLAHFAGSSAERGERERRAVLGGGHVDRELAAGARFGAAFQGLLTRWPWGEVWARPALDRSTRRLLAVAMLACLGRSEELEMHLRAALDAGCEREALAVLPEGAQDLEDTFHRTDEHSRRPLVLGCRPFGGPLFHFYALAVSRSTASWARLTRSRAQAITAAWRWAPEG